MGQDGALQAIKCCIMVPRRIALLAWRKGIIDQQYGALQRQAIGIEGAYRSMLDRPRHAVARIVWMEFTALIVDLRQKKHPNTIDARVLRIQRYLLSVRDGSNRIMRIDETVNLHKQCERFRMELRKLHNYQ